jgi:hypothetical protein
MAAREDKPQLIVGRFRLGTQPVGRDGLGQLASAPVPPYDVDGTVPRGRHDPARWIVRNTVTRPPIHRRHKGILYGVLGQADVTEQPDQRTHSRTVGLAERPLDVVHPPPPVSGLPASVRWRGTAVPRCRGR